MLKVGDFTLRPIEAGMLGLDGGAMFGIVPKSLWEKKIPADTRNRIPLATRCLLIEGDGRKILVDTGVGTKLSPKLQDIYAVDQGEQSLLGSLEKAGLSPEDITDVILTHMHFDHCGGSTHYVDDQPVPTFPNATYHVQASALEAARRPNQKEKASFFPENWEPVSNAGRLNVVDGASELFPGIELKVVRGHTEGMQLVSVTGGGHTAVFCADLIPTSAHIPVVWVMGYDCHPLVTVTEKKLFLTQAVQEGWTLIFEHDPYLAAGTVTMDEEGRFNLDTEISMTEE